MKVKLIAITKSLIPEINSSEELISYVARVSNPSNQLNVETAPRLLKYCITHEHWSIFEHSYMTVEIKTSRAIAAQILRHRSFVFQEFSQRYSQSTSFEDIEWRLQGKTNRQVGDETTNLPPHLQEKVVKTLESCKELYDNLIDSGVAKECARMVLPLTTETTMYMTGNCRSFIHYIGLRTSQGTQKEHRLIAEEIKSIFTEQFPCISKALQWIIE